MQMEKLQSRKVDPTTYTICHDSMKDQSESLSDQFATITHSSEDKLQEMRDLVHRRYIFYK